MKRLIAPSSIFVLLMAVYLWTLAPGNFWIDSAAFSACNEILGLPHSPGFPLYTILGRTVHALLPTNPALSSNLYSALATAGAGVVFYMILGLLISPLKLSPGLKHFISVAGALFAFLTVPIWQSAVRAEVYALQILLSLIIIYLVLRAYREKDAARTTKFILAAVFIQGLAFTNHSLLAIITFPLLIILPSFMLGQRWMGYLAKLIPVAVVVFCLAISVYVYLPIRSNQDPAINSGQPKTLAAMVQAITRSGEDYLPTSKEDKANYLTRAAGLGSFIFDQTGALILLGLGAALFIAVRQRLKVILLLFASVLTGLGITVWAADFQRLNFDIVAYSALPLMILMMLAFYGLGYLSGRFSARRNLGRFVPVILILMIIFQFTGNLYAGDLSGTRGPDRLAESILDKAPSNSILLLSEDNTVLPLWYHCLALGKRPDIAVISAGGLYRPSYRNELRVLYPDLLFPPEFNAPKIEDFARAVSSFCEMNRANRPIMVQFGVPGIAADQITPSGFLFQYAPSQHGPEVAADYPTTEILDSIAAGATDLLTKDFVARTAFNYGVFFDRIGQIKPAYRFFRYAIESDPENPNYLLRLGVAFLKAGKDDQAILLLEEAARTGKGCPEAETLLKELYSRKYGKL